MIDMKFLRWMLLTLSIILLAACNIQSVEQFEKMEEQERSTVEQEPTIEETPVEMPTVTELAEPAPETKELVKEQEVETAPIEQKAIETAPGEQKVTEKAPAKVLDKKQPVTEKPKQQETQKQTVSTPKKGSVTISIRADTLLKHWDLLEPALQSEKYVPSSGVILKAMKYELLSEKDTVWDVLLRATKEHKVQLEYQGANENIYSSVYIEGINHLYEFSAGPLSGWMYKVNGNYPNYGASQFKLKDGDVIQWDYTVDLGRDLGSYWNGES